MTGSALSIDPTAIPFGRVAAGTATPTPGTTPVPTTTPPDATGGLGLAAALVALAFLGAAVVTAGGALVAGWATFRGGFLGLEVGPRQRWLFAVAAVCFVLSLFAVLGDVGPTLGSVFLAVFGIGVAASVAGVGWVLASNARDWLRRQG